METVGIEPTEDSSRGVVTMRGIEAYFRAHPEAWAEHVHALRASLDAPSVFSPAVGGRTA